MNDNTSGITYTITIDPTPQQHKPTKKQMGIITNHLNLVTGLTINEFPLIQLLLIVILVVEDYSMERFVMRIGINNLYLL